MNVRSAKPSAMAQQVNVVAHKISGSQLKPNSVTGKQVNESTLGIAPKASSANTAKSANSATTAGNAAKLGGQAASADALATAAQGSGLLHVPLGTNGAPVLDRAPLDWTASCGDLGGGATGVELGATASENATLIYSTDGENVAPTIHSITAGDSYPVASTGAIPATAALVQYSVIGADGKEYQGQVMVETLIGSTGCGASITASRS